MKKVYFVLFQIVLVSSLAGQALFNNNGADIYVKDGGLVVIKTNSLYNTQVGGSGILENNGTIVVEGNVTNDGIVNAGNDTIRLFGNWINNNSYTGNNSWVDMYGTAQQISGTAVTTFNNLNLGGGNSVKLQTINSVTSGTLALNDAELATDVNEMLVTNNNPGAITRNSGFVSSLGNGRLSRATATNSAYLFPVGSPSYNNPPSMFRPLEFQPTASAANIYGAMVVKGDATIDGYSINSLDDQLCKVNPHFYHRLYHASGSDDISLRMFYDPAADGDWTDQAHWDAPNRWNYLGTSTAGNGLGFSTVTVGGVNDFLPESFALARRKFTLDAGPDVNLTAGGNTQFNPVIGTLAVSSILWAPDATLTCANCENPVASPTGATWYTITVIDEGGCSVSDSLLVNVTAPELLIPTAFSPNGDGMNDKFRALNKDLKRYNLQVFNRWGEKVYESTDPNEGWDGIYKGFEQEMGVYVWQCDYQLAGQTKALAAKGNVTLLR